MGERLGKAISGARAVRGKTLRGLSAEVGVSPALLSLIEQGKHEPQPELIVTLANVLGADADGWCALAGRVQPDVESDLASLARRDPAAFKSFLRTMVDKARRPSHVEPGKSVRARGRSAS